MSATPPADEVLTVEIAGGVATVTLNRPEARNALNARLRRSLATTMGGLGLGRDDEVDVIVLTGADPAFCAGLDLKELGADGTLSGETGSEAADPDMDVTGAISGGARPFPETAVPVVGAVNGVAITGGFELALACDLLVASERAQFADTHTRVGIQPGWGLTVALPRAVGLARARELSFTGNFCDAQTALRWGLVNHVVAHDDLLPFARALAADIAGNDRAGVARIRRTYDEGALGTGREALALEGRVAAEWLADGGGADVEARRRAVTDRGRAQL